MNITDRRCTRCGEVLQPGQQVCSNGHVVFNTINNAIPLKRAQDETVSAADAQEAELDPTILPATSKRPAVKPQPANNPSANEATIEETVPAGQLILPQVDPHDEQTVFAAEPTNEAQPEQSVYTEYAVAPAAKPAQSFYPGQGPAPVGTPAPVYPGYPQPPYPHGQVGQPGQPGQPPYPYPGYPQPPFVPGQPGPMGYPANPGYPPYPQPPYPYAPYPPKKRSSTGKILLIIGSVVLVIVIVSCALVFKGVQLGIQQAATIRATAVVATSTALSNSGSGSGQTNVPAPTGQALFTDNFADNSNNWQLSNDPNYNATIANNTLKMHCSGTDLLLENVPGSDNWTDFRLDATYIPNLPGSNDVVGIIFRGQPTGDNSAFKGYLVEIDNQGNYAIRKPKSLNASNSEYTDLLTGQMSKPPLLGTAIDVTLMVKGNKIALYLNGSLVESFTDTMGGPTLNKGYVGLYVVRGGTSGAAEATFNHVDAYPAPTTMPIN